MAKIVVGIDAGHGMKTPGKRTPPLKKDIVINGRIVRKKGEVIHEHEFNRAVSKLIASGLQRHDIGHLYTADMTGSSDISLSARAKKANANRVNILISCHYNAIGSCASYQTRTKGLLVLRTASCSQYSITLGNHIHNHLKKDCKYSYSFGVRKDVDVSGFTLAILKQTTMPAVLLEYGFMDYEPEAVKMLDPVWQKQCAEATVKGICQYFNVPYISEETYKEGTYKVIVDSLNIRQGPGVSHNTVGAITDKGLCIIEKVDGNWGQLSDGRGWICITPNLCEYVPPVSIEKEELGIPYSIKVTCDSLNVRNGPGVDHDKIASIEKDEEYVIVEEKEVDGSKWGLIKMFKSYRNGWVNLSYVKKM